MLNAGAAILLCIVALYISSSQKFAPSKLNERLGMFLYVGLILAGLVFAIREAVVSQVDAVDAAYLTFVAAAFIIAVLGKQLYPSKTPPSLCDHCSKEQEEQQNNRAPGE